MPATSKSQQKLFALARAVQKGKVPASKVGGSVKDIARDVSAKDVEDFASTPTKKLPQKVKKEDVVNEASGGGDCYEVNGRYFVDNELFPSLNKRQSTNMRLVHGVAILQTDGKPFGHCWLEDGNQVLDFSNGKNIKMPKQVYYALGQIPAPGYDKIYKYTTDEVAKKILKTEHWGPWDLKPPR